MTKLLLCTVFLLGLQTARAEEAPAQETPAQEAAQVAPSTEKSFFDSVTADDLQRIANFNGQDLPAQPGEDLEP